MSAEVRGIIQCYSYKDLTSPCDCISDTTTRTIIKPHGLHASLAWTSWQSKKFVSLQAVRTPACGAKLRKDACRRTSCFRGLKLLHAVSLHNNQHICLYIPLPDINTVLQGNGIRNCQLPGTANMLNATPDVVLSYDKPTRGEV